MSNVAMTVRVWRDPNPDSNYRFKYWPKDQNTMCLVYQSLNLHKDGQLIEREKTWTAELKSTIQLSETWNFELINIFEKITNLLPYYHKKNS